jgi:CRP-like cAMP-binding protein
LTPKSDIRAGRPPGKWFGSLPEALQVAILDRSRERRFGPGEFLVREGEPGKGMFGLLEGRTRHTRSIGDSDEVLMHIGEPGLWFGEYPLLSGQPAIGSIAADGAVRTLFLPKAAFDRIVEAEPRFYRAFNLLLCERFALSFRLLAEARGLSPEDWLRQRLAGVAEVQGRAATVPAAQTTLTMSQTELASMVGLSRQTLNVLLTRLQARGLVEIGYRKIRLLA